MCGGSLDPLLYVLHLLESQEFDDACGLNNEHIIASTACLLKMYIQSSHYLQPLLGNNSVVHFPPIGHHRIT